MPKSPNDDRSEVKNPTSDAHKGAADNRSRQMNPKDTATKGGKK